MNFKWKKQVFKSLIFVKKEVSSVAVKNYYWSLYFNDTSSFKNPDCITKHSGHTDEILQRFNMWHSILPRETAFTSSIFHCHLWHQLEH